ncbi:MAG: hypothetical protein ACYSU1_00200 [Planctomycetota bacterium]|jgi:hypothetical protein
MRKKDLEIHCPDCGSRLRIDPETGAILAHGEDKPTDLKEVQARIEAREGKRADAFGDALDAERGRGRELDDLFRKAAEKAKDSKDEDAPDNPLDERWR